MCQPFNSRPPKGFSPLALLALGLAFALPSGFLSAADEDSVGYVRLTTSPGEDTLTWSDPDRFKTVPLKENDKFCGSVASAVGSTITVSNTPAWLPNELVYTAGTQSRTYFVEVTSGSGAGLKFQIVSNTSNSITVDLNGGSLAGVAADDEIRICSYWTLNLLFPDGGTLTPSTSGGSGTQVIFPSSAVDGPAFLGVARFTFRSDLGFWTDESAPAVDAGDYPIAHDSLLVIRQDPGVPVQTHFKGFHAKVGEGLRATISYAVSEPEITVEQPVGTSLTDGLTSKDFGSVALGANADLTFTVRNDGAAELTGLSVSIDGTNSGDFSAGPLGATSLGVGQSTTFSVTFAPSATGSRTAALHVTSNDTDENPFDINLSGNALAPEIEVENPLANSLVDGNDTVDFGMIDLGSSSQQTFTIRNSGTATLTGLSASVDGFNAADFVSGIPGATDLNPGGTTTVIVTFMPSAIGGRAAALHVFSNDSDENPFDIALSGTGKEEAPEPEPGRVELPGDSGVVPGASPIAWSEQAAGSYAGLIENADSAPAGWFSASKVSSTGAFSAKFSINGVSKSIKGVLDEATGTFSDTVTDNKTGKTYAVALGLEESADGFQISATIDVDGDLFTARGTQSSFHKTTNPAPWAGRYTFLFPSDPDQADGSLQPLGDGYAIGTIATSGTVKISGRLGDGTKLSLATVAGADGTIQVYRDLYRTTPKGSLGGTLFIREVDNVSDIDGTLKWVKFADPRESLYPDGFDLDQPAIGGLYHAPYPDEQILSNLNDSDNNARLMIAEGNVAALPELPFTWTEANKAIYSPVGTEKLSLKFSKSTGFFSGSYVDKSTGHSIKLAGAVLQPQQIASGHFIGEGQTGYVHISVATAPGIEVTELQTGTTLIDGTTTPSAGDGTDFGDAGFEGGSAQRSFVITNVGDGDLVLTETPVINEATPNFSVVAVSGGILKTGDSTLLKLIFQPVTVGTHTAEVAIYSNDRATNPFTFAVQGTGIAGSLTTTAGGDGSFAGDTPTDSAPGMAMTEAAADTFPKGTFTGIVREDAPGQATAGYLHLILSKGGLSAFSASFDYDDGKRYRFKNLFDPVDGSASGDIVKVNGEIMSYTLQLQTTVATGDARISGTLIDGDRELIFTLSRSGFDKTNPVEESLQGRYTMLIIGNEDLRENYPHGDGAVLVSLNSTGTIRAAGTLGDGSTFSHSGTLSRDLEWQLLKFLYRTKPKGFISGTLTFRDLPGISDFDGELQWEKYPHSSERYFSRGFALTAKAIGSKYVKPASGEFAMPDLVDTIDNADFSTNDAGIFAPAPSDIVLTWSTKNKLTFNRVGTETVKLSVSTKTGALSGSYSDKTNSAAAKIKGVVFQKQGLSGGVSNSGTTTGSILITPRTP